MPQDGHRHTYNDYSLLPPVFPDWGDLYVQRRGQGKGRTAIIISGLIDEAGKDVYYRARVQDGSERTLRIYAHELYDANHNGHYWKLLRRA